ncbi:MAG: FliA/WhiG family RNA polymerase sigma factor [Oscillospiraceae bacterium]|nr:FliA/WhiG family RNA polymerase sigma factor [Oscillospiraceae bacterium]
MTNNNTELFYKYKESGDLTLRNEIVLLYMDLVSQIAAITRNMYAKGYDVDDLVNEGVIALIASVEAFDPGRGIKFETYAKVKIRGAIIDYIRAQDWVPRRVRKFGRKLDTAYGVLYNELGRTPTNSELAEHLELTDTQFKQLLSDTAAVNTLSFEEMLYEDNISVFNASMYGTSATGSGGVDARLYAQERKQVIAEAIAQLKPKEQQVVSLYYYENLKLIEIAEVIGVTESRVSQIHSKCMLLLKTKLEHYIKNLS